MQSSQENLPQKRRDSPPARLKKQDAEGRSSQEKRPGGPKGTGGRSRISGPKRSGPPPKGKPAASPPAKPPSFSGNLRSSVAVREGEEGTEIASEGRVAVVVDALRMSATACSLLEAGAKEILIVAELESARRLAAERPGAVTVGERDGRQVEGFDLGNSPVAAKKADVKGKTVVMTTTTGALRVVSAQGAPSVLLGGPRNLSAVAVAAANAARDQKADVVVIAAGASEGAAGMAVEDLASASLIAGKLKDMAAKLEPGGFVNVPAQAFPELFRNCPSGRKLKELGFGADVPYCAEIDKTTVVPVVTDWLGLPGGDVAAVVRAL